MKIINIKLNILIRLMFLTGLFLLLYALPVRAQSLIISKGADVYEIRYDTATDKVTGVINSNALDSSSDLSNEEWHYVTMTFDGLNQRLFFDGELEAAGTAGAITFNSSDITIGSSTQGYLIDDVKIFNTALTPDQVAREYVTGPGPVGFWRFEEQATSTAYDTSGYGNNAVQFTDANLPDWATIGKLGGALRFNGASEYLIVAADLDYSFGGGFTVSVWAKPDAIDADGHLVNRFDGATDGYYIFQSSTDSGLWDSYTWQGGVFEGANGLSQPTGNWQNIVLTRQENNNLILYIDGIPGADQGILAGDINPGSQPLYIGADQNTGNKFNGLIDEVKIYNYTRTQRQIMQDYNQGGPVGFWKFEEGYGSTTKDISGFDNNASLFFNIEWTLDGKAGSALVLGRSINDRLQVTDNAEFQIATSSGATISIWAKHNGVMSTNRETLVDNESLGGYKLMMGDNGTVAFAIDDDASWTPDDIASSTKRYDDSAWHYLVGVKNSTNNIKIYVDGELAGSDNSLSAVNKLNHSNIGIGYDFDTNTFWDGTLDEVKIFNYARLPDEIRADYNSAGGAAGKGSALTLGSARNAGSTWDDGGFGGAAPVGYWRFEELTGQNVNDSSGSVVNAGTLGASSSSGSDDPVWKSLGKVGGALEFDGTDDYVNIGATGQSVQTASFWIKADSTTGDIIDFDSGTHSIETTSGTLTATGWTSPTMYINASSTNGNNIIPVGKWKHITVTTGTGFTASNLQIGTETAFFDGLIDEVKIYSYARSLPQIAFDYDGGKPMGHWKFDEGSGGTARDSSGNGHAGTIYPGTGGGNTATSTMWSNGTSGKFNSALDFDGTDDYVNVGTLNASTSAVSFWLYADANNTDIMDFDGGTHSVEISSANVISATGWASPQIYVNGQDTTTAGTGAWYHIAVTSATAFSVTALHLGTETSYFNGRLDDVRVYSYPLNYDLVIKLYNGGAAVRF